MTRIEVEIEELVLHGFGRIDGAAVADEVQRVLAARFSGAPLDRVAARTADRVDAGSIELRRAASPHTLGQAIADRLHGSIAR